MLSDFELTRIAKLIDPEASGFFTLLLKKAAKAGAEETIRSFLDLLSKDPRGNGLTIAAQLCRNKYCELVPGKRTWEELTEREQEADIVCLGLAISSFLRGES